MNVDLIWPFFLIGLATGGLYSLLGTGVVLAYRASGYLHIAHAGVAMTCAVSYAWIGRTMPVGFAAVLCIALGAAITTLLYRYVFARLERETMAAKVVVSVAAGIGLQAVGGVILVNSGILSGKPRAGSLFSEETRVELFGASLTVQQLAVPVIAIAVVIALQYALKRTDLGLALRASAQNPLSASLAGLPSAKVTTLAWSVTGALGGLAGVLAVSISSFLIPTFLFAETVRGLAASLAGGFVDLRKTALAAFTLGILEQQLVGFEPPWNELRGAIGFALITVVAVFGLSRATNRAGSIA